MKQILKNIFHKEQDIDSLTYCNVCLEDKEIVQYFEELDYALCTDCKGSQAAYSYLKSVVDSLIESIAS